MIEEDYKMTPRKYGTILSSCLGRLPSHSNNVHNSNIDNVCYKWLEEEQKKLQAPTVLWVSHLCRQDSLLKDTNHHNSGVAVTWDGHRKPLLLLSIARRSVQGLSCVQECESGFDFQTPVHHVLLYPFSGTGYQLVANLTAVAICSVGVWTTVDWATSGGCIFSASAACQ